MTAADDVAGLAGVTGITGAAGSSALSTYIPNQWLDLTDTKLPSKPHEVYELCRYLACTSPAHKTYVRNFSTLPVTEVLVRNAADTSDAVKKATGGNHAAGARQPGVIAIGGDDGATQWANYLDKTIKLRSFLKQFAATACMYSAAVALIQRPFVKQCTCPHCGTPNDLRPGSFQLVDGYLRAKVFSCDTPSCQKTFDAPIRDMIISHDKYRIKPVVLDMNCIRSLRNQFTGAVRLYYRIPDSEVEMIEYYARYDHEMFLGYRQEYLEAVLSPAGHALVTDGTGGRVMRLRDEEVFIWTSPFPSHGIHGLPIPDMVASFKETWLLRIYEKSSQATAAQGLNPLTILFPAPSPGGTTLWDNINVSNYMPVIADVVKRHSSDPNYRGVMPFPVGSHTVGGEGKALTVHQEIRATMEMICASLGCPVEFLFGGMSYSGSNVSIKQVLALLQEMQTGLKELAQWVSDHISIYCEEPGNYLLDMADLRIGDDLAFVGALSSMVSAGQLSMSRLHAELRINHEAEKKAIEDDIDFNNKIQKKRADLEAENQANIMKAQAQAQGRGAGIAALAELGQAVQNALAVRRDHDMITFLGADPNRMMQFLGPNAPELRRAQSMVERTMHAPVDPSMHGAGPQPVPPPTPAAEGGPLDLESRIAENVANFTLQGDGQEEEAVEENPEAAQEMTLEDLVASFSQIPVNRWEEAFAVAKNDAAIDPAILQELRSMLDGAKAQRQADMPEQRAGIRDPLLGGGGGGI
jgi:hypothetical protein